MKQALLALTTVAALALLASSSALASDTWTGGSNDWTNADSWSPSVPGTLGLGGGNSDVAVFSSGGAGTAITVTDADATRSLGSIAFVMSGSLANYTIGSSSNTIYIDAANAGGNVYTTYTGSQSSASETILSNIDIGDTGTNDLRIETASDFTGTITLSGNIQSIDTTGTSQIAIDTSTTQTGSSLPNDTVVLSGVISNNGSNVLSLRRFRDGVLVLSGANTYSGGFTQGVSDGAYTITRVGISSVGSATTSNLTSGAFGTGTLTLNSGEISSNSTTAYTIGNAVIFTGSGTGSNPIILGDSNASYNGALTFTGPVGLTVSATTALTINSKVTMSGVLSGSSAALTKLGTGTLALTGINSYSGATTVSAGTLLVTGSIADSTLSVAGGATLAGTGTTGAVSLASGGAINLADGVIGKLTIGSLTTTGGGTLTFEIGGTTTATDEISSGALTASGSTSIDVANLGGSSQTLASGTYTILAYTGTQQSLTDFSLSTTSLDGKTLSLAQSGDDIEVVVAGTTSATSTTYTLSTTAGSTLLHSGATTTLTTTVTNTGTGTADTLDYSDLGATAANGTVTGGSTSGGPLAQSATGTNTQTFTATTAGTGTITPTGTGTNATAGGSATLTSATGTSITVYSGVGVWNTNGGGSWGAISATPTNWTATGGTPGITAGYLSTDSASFGAVLTSGTGSVTLDGDNPSLNAITFDDSNASYVIAQGSGTGSITLDGNGGNANVTDVAGTHTISAPIDLATSANVNVASGQQLTISGTVSGTGGLVNDGSGTTILSGSNNYSGGTTVSSGLLELNNGTNGSATGSGALNVGAGAMLAGIGSSSGSSFSITGSSSAVAMVFVGHNSASDLNTTGVMNLSATGASSIGSANLVFNLNSAVAGQGNQLNVGATNITFNTVGSLNTTLTLNLQGSSIIASGTTYVLVAGTGTTTIGAGDLTSGQYAGLTVAENSQGQEVIETGSTSKLELAYGTAGQASYYAPSYLILVDNGGVDDIDVEVVPEPGTWAMMLGGLLLLIGVQRIRRNRL